MADASEYAEYDNYSDGPWFEDEDELPEGVEDNTPPSYNGPLIHGKCPKCGRESGVGVFPTPGYCNGDDCESMVEWENVGGDE